MGSPAWEIPNEVKKLIDCYVVEHLPVYIHYNATYTKKDIAYTILDAIGSKKFVTAKIDELKAENIDVSSSSNLFKKLKKINPEEIIKYYELSNAGILKHAKRCGAFGRPKILAIDGHDIAWYGDKNRKELVSVKNRRGTNLGHRYTSIESVEDFERFTFASIPTKQFDAKEELIRNLVLETMKWVDIALLLLDKGYYNVKCINMLSSLKVPFLMPVLRNKKIQNLQIAAFRLAACIPDTPNRYYVTEYTMVNSQTKKTATFNIVFYFTPNKNPTEFDDCFIFATNQEVSVENVTKLANLYRKRWGIENGYKVKEELRGKTCSRYYSTRLLFQMLSILLYNIWALFNYIHRKKAKKLKKGWLYFLTIPRFRAILTRILKKLASRKFIFPAKYPG